MGLTQRDKQIKNREGIFETCSLLAVGPPSSTAELLLPPKNKRLGVQDSLTTLKVFQKECLFGAWKEVQVILCFFSTIAIGGRS